MLQSQSKGRNSFLHSTFSETFQYHQINSNKIDLKIILVCITVRWHFYVVFFLSHTMAKRLKKNQIVDGNYHYLSLSNDLSYPIRSDCKIFNF